jgi:allantoinase
MSSLDHVEFRAHATRGRRSVRYGSGLSALPVVHGRGNSSRGNTVQVLLAEREAGNRELLWRGLAEGTIDRIVSDHSPCTAELKRFDSGAFGVAWAGIALQLGLSAVWTEASRRGHTLMDVVRWIAESPSGQVGFTNKGHIALDYAPPTSRCSRPPRYSLSTRPNCTTRTQSAPTTGCRWPGLVRSTWLASQRINLGETPRGRPLASGPPDLGANAIHTLISRTR